MDRKEFISFLGKSTLVVIGTTSATSLLTGCSLTDSIKALKPSFIDDVIFTDQFSYKLLISWKDAINNSEEFGSDNDYIAFIPLENDNEALLWVNHEAIDPLFIHGKKIAQTKEDYIKETDSVGGSILHLLKKENDWVITSSKYNRRISANTDISLDWFEEIAGSKTALGTLGNCAGGVTPWNTILTCEENYSTYVGEVNYKTGKYTPSTLGWEKHDKRPPEHYGWVVEINPKSGESKKLISIGRCAHECATVFQLEDGRCVVYSGDDEKGEHLYKFVSDKPNDISRGELFVANLEQGEWVSLDREKHDVLKKGFKSQTDIQIHLRYAAKLVGATPLDRPEDIEIDPITQDVFVALTNNSDRKNYHGSILKISEQDKSKPVFTSETYLVGGETSGLSCPDNLVFDKKGNLWITSDISGSKVGKSPYEPFGNNGLFVIPRLGKNAGKPIQVASAPVDAEFTGPCFSKDGKTLFLSVQHPGSKTKDLTNPTSKWPNGSPKSSVIQIQSELFI